MKYLNEECKQCEEYISPYGCSWHGCPIYKEYEQGRAEEGADFDHDKRKEERMESRIHPIFDEILKPFIGGGNHGN